MSIPTAQATLKAERSALAGFKLIIAAEYPEPQLADCDDDADYENQWEAWNEAYEQAYAEQGGYGLERRIKAAEDALIRLCADHVSTLAASIGATDDVDTVIAVALGERHHRRFYSTRRRVLELCERLAP